jgi:uncharacterized protein Smg (DUF494 family)
MEKIIRDINKLYRAKREYQLGELTKQLSNLGYDENEIYKAITLLDDIKWFFVRYLEDKVTMVFYR